MSIKELEYGNLVDPYVVDRAKYYSNKLISSGFYHYYEKQDLIQDFIMSYLRYKDSYDPNKSKFKYFVSVIFDRLYQGKIDKAINRSRRKIYYLIDDDESCSTLDRYSWDETNSKNQEGSLTAVNPFFMSFDMINSKCLIDKLPENKYLKEIAYLVIDGYTVAEISSKLNISKKSVYKKIRQIEKYFLERS